MTSAIPNGYPLDVITARVEPPIDDLGNQSIVDYLLSGGDPGEATAFVDELQRW